VFEFPNVGALSRHLLQTELKLDDEEDKEKGVDSGDRKKDETLDDVKGLSEDGVKKLLLKELEDEGF